MPEKKDSHGAIPIPRESDIKSYDPKGAKAKAIRADRAADERGGPLSEPQILHPTQTVEDSPAYRRADGSRHSKE